MSKVVREEIDQLNATITVTIKKEDYEPRLKEELNKYRKKAQIKGFRKGKTPLSFIKKMYGRSVLADVINDMLQKEVNNYLVEKKLDLLGQPIPSEKQENIDFDVQSLDDFNFKFDLGLAPEFEVQGASAETEIERYKVEIAGDMVDTELENAQKQVGKRTLPEDGIEEGDLIKFNAEELEGEDLKENGWAASFSILMEKIADEELKSELLNKKTGDKVRFNVFELEEGKDEAYTRKYLLDMPEEEAQEVGPMFEAEIAEVSRVEKADLDQEFFDQYFGENEVTTVTEAKEKIKEKYVDFYDRQADSLLFRDLKERLLQLNELNLPDEFLKRWLKTSSEKNTDAIVEDGYPDFAEDLRWTLIKNKLLKQYELELSEEEIRAAFADRVRGYFGAYGGDDLIQSTVTRLMEDQKQVEQVAEELIAEKLFQKLKEEVTLLDKPVQSDEFDEILKAARQEIEDRRNQNAAKSVTAGEEEE